MADHDPQPDASQPEPNAERRVDPSSDPPSEGPSSETPPSQAPAEMAAQTSDGSAATPGVDALGNANGPGGLGSVEKEPAPQYWAPWRQKLHTIIFEADTKAGKLFDIVLLFAIGLSILAIMLESVDEYGGEDGSMRSFLLGIEWFFTIIFTIEYVLRVICVRKPIRYMFSFFGIVDLLAVLPTYLTLFGLGSRYTGVIRGLRLMRIFRVLKLGRHLNAGRDITNALKASAEKVTVFLLTVMTLTVIMGSVMYMVEGSEEGTGFTSIPRGVYWAIVTLTTVGYGDISPQTPLGQAIAAAIMIMGYSILAVPTGIVSAEMVRDTMTKGMSTQSCPDCQLEGHAFDARHCRRCGARL